MQLVTKIKIQLNHMNIQFVKPTETDCSEQLISLFFMSYQLKREKFLRKFNKILQLKGYSI